MALHVPLSTLVPLVFPLASDPALAHVSPEALTRYITTSDPVHLGTIPAGASIVTAAPLDRRAHALMAGRMARGGVAAGTIEAELLACEAAIAVSVESISDIPLVRGPDGYPVAELWQHIAGLPDPVTVVREISIHIHRLSAPPKAPAPSSRSSRGAAPSNATGAPRTTATGATGAATPNGRATKPGTSSTSSQPAKGSRARSAQRAS